MIRLILFILFFLWVVKYPYAYRDSIRTAVINKTPEVYLPMKEREASQTFIYASQNYKAGDRRRIKAALDLALIRRQRLLFGDAEKLYRQVINEDGERPGFNQDREEAMIQLAAVLDTESKFDQSIASYSQLLEYDQKYFAKNDVHIARDYNNLGLSTYLKALSKDRGSYRMALLTQADNYYKQALQKYHVQPKNQEPIAVVLYNEHLALRDLDDWDGARLAKAQSIAIRNRFDHGSREL